jgi:hypothetical protein
VTHPAFSWILDAIRDREYDVGSLMPPVFDAYARVFPPAHRRVPAWPDDVDAPVTWHAVAAANRRIAHPAMEWGSIVGSWSIAAQPGLWDSKPECHEIPAAIANEINRILTSHTGTDRLHYAVWEGYGEVHTAMRDNAPQLRDADILHLPMRRMYVTQGSIDDAAEPFRLPERTADLWWPADHAWCVATDVDLMTTYIGGSIDSITALLSSDALEAMPVTSEQRITWDTDTINPQPAPPR